MPRKQDFHVLPHDDGWSVKREGAKRAGSVHDTKIEAIEAGRERAKREKVELVIHLKNGKIQDLDSYGNDPPSIKDKVP